MKNCKAMWPVRHAGPSGTLEVFQLSIISNSLVDPDGDETTGQYKGRRKRSGESHIR